MQIETDVSDGRGEFLSLMIQVANCPNLARCRSDCQKLDKTKFPSPDFVGRRYRGLVIVGGNPGNSYNASTSQSDQVADQLMDRVRMHGRQEDAEKVLEFYPSWMLSWKQIVNASHREILRFDIEEVAYLNLVKCKTLVGSSNTLRLVGTEVFERCADTYALRQLEILRPRFLVGLWQPIRGMLEGAGFSFRGIQYAAYNGQHSLPLEERLSDIKRLFAQFNQTKEA
jgi:hypothetical protein